MRIWILLVVMVSVLLCSMPMNAQFAFAADDDPTGEPQAADEIVTTRPLTANLYTQEVAGAVRRGLKYLAETQNQDGSWGQQFQVASTSFAGLAMLANGSTTNRGRYAKNLKKAVEYMLGCQQASGYYKDNSSRMHGQGFATMFMAEVYGMSNSGSIREPDDFTKKIKDSLDRAIDVICHSQATCGGFPYTPTAKRGTEHEGSITVCCVEGMRAARNAGISVPKTNIDEAVDYMKKTYGNGSFAYRLGTQPGGSYALSAAGACVLIATGDTSEPVMKMINECIDFMWNFAPGNGANAYVTGHYFYSHFYAAQAYHFRGGRDWQNWYKGMKRVLLSEQISLDGDRQGYWNSPGSEAGGDTAFSTGIALLILQMPNEYLPIFQN